MPRIYHRKCDSCGREYKGEGERFCSNECSKQHRRNNMKQQWDLSCEFCGKKFKVEYKYRKQRFCSNECRSRHLDKNHPRRILIDITCKGCGKVFKVMPSKSFRQYCSLKCWGSVNKKERKRREHRYIAASLNTKYYNIKKRSEQNKWEHLSLAELSKWFMEQEKRCAYCGIPLETWELLFKGHQNKSTLTIDRKNSELGYIKENMCLACSQCNIAKSNVFSFEEMKEIGEKYIKPKWQKKLQEVQKNEILLG